jgi:hypothetical protein
MQRDADRCHEQFQTDKDSDFVVILNVWKAYVASGYDAQWAQRNYLNEKSLDEAVKVRLELLDVLAEHGIQVSENAKLRIDKNALGKAITAGLIGNLMIAYRGHRFKKVDGTKDDIGVHPGSILANRSFPDGTLLVSDEIFINPQNKAYACNCLEVKREWLQQVAPEQAKRYTKPQGHFTRHSRHTIYSRPSKNRR